MQKIFGHHTSTRMRTLMVFLALAGLADAAYLADMALTGGTLVCDIQGLSGCNTVAQSAYSWVLGLPLALYGVFFYCAFLITLVLYGRIGMRTYEIALMALAAIGVLFSSYFLYLQLFVIEALCIYCIGSAVVSYFLALLVFFGSRKETEVVL